MVGMIKLMQSQQRRQLEGLNKVSLLWSRLIEWSTSNSCREFTQEGYRAIGIATNTSQWLQQDINALLSTDTPRSQLQALLEAITTLQDQVS